MYIDEKQHGINIINIIKRWKGNSRENRPCAQNRRLRKKKKKHLLNNIHSRDQS